MIVESICSIPAKFKCFKVFLIGIKTGQELLTSRVGFIIVARYGKYLIENRGKTSWKFNRRGEWVANTLLNTLKSKTEKLKSFTLRSLLKTKNCWIKCICLDINRDNRDKIKLKEQVIDNKEFKWSKKHIKFVQQNTIKVGCSFCEITENSA